MTPRIASSEARRSRRPPKAAVSDALRLGLDRLRLQGTRPVFRQRTFHTVFPPETLDEALQLAAPRQSGNRVETRTAQITARSDLVGGAPNADEYIGLAWPVVLGYLLLTTCPGLLCAMADTAVYSEGLTEF